MDHLGMGLSDKPINVDDHNYLMHCDRLTRFIQTLDLEDINLFAQDWGSLIGLRVVGLNPERFAKIAVGNADLPVIPANFQIVPTIENPNKLDSTLVSPYLGIPDQHTQAWYDECDLLVQPLDFQHWVKWSMKGASYRPQDVIEALTYYDLTEGEEAAYSAPFPSRTYMAGPRKFPSFSNDLAGTTSEAWENLKTFSNPFLTLWGPNDNGNIGSCEIQQKLIDQIKGAENQPHDRLNNCGHFLQDDQGYEIATRLLDFF